MEYRGTSAMRQAETMLNQAARKIDKTQQNSTPLRETSKMPMGGMKDALRDGNPRKTGSF